MDTTFPAKTNVTRRATLQETYKVIISSMVILPDEVQEAIDFANRRGIYFFSNWTGCLSIIPIRFRGKKRYRVSVTLYPTSVPF